MSLSRDLRYAAQYWREAYELLVNQTGRDLNDGLGLDPRSRAAKAHRSNVTGPGMNSLQTERDKSREEPSQ